VRFDKQSRVSVFFLCASEIDWLQYLHMLITLDATGCYFSSLAAGTTFGVGRCESVITPINSHFVFIIYTEQSSVLRKKCAQKKEKYVRYSKSSCMQPEYLNNTKLWLCNYVSMYSYYYCTYMSKYVVGTAENQYFILAPSPLNQTKKKKK